MKPIEFYTILRKNNYFLEAKLLLVFFLPFLVECLFSEFVNIYSTLFLFAVLFVVDIFFKNKYNAFLLAILVYVFYSHTAYIDSLSTIHNLRFRYFSVCFISLSYLFLLIYDKLVINYKYLNSFLFVFALSKCLSILIIAEISSEGEIKQFNSSEEKIDFNGDYRNEQPVIFILLDELSSAKEIFKHSNDSLAFEFGSALKEMGFSEKDDLRSLSSHTKYSLPSMFNFNLHNAESVKIIDRDTTEGFKKSIINKKFISLFEDNLLVDSLLKKNVEVNSYGLVDFRKAKKSLFNNFVWQSTFELKSGFSIFDGLIQRTAYGYYLKKKLWGENYYPFREQAVQKFKSFQPQKNNFYYFHFLFPHSPFVYKGEYDKQNFESDLDEYIAFRLFSLRKMKELLNDKKFNNTRIIIIGDHGYRNDPRINKFSTSLYLKGYDGIFINNDFVAQDIGFLINASF